MVGALVAARLLAHRHLTPGRGRRTARRRARLAAAVRMVDRVHRDAAHRRALAADGAGGRPCRSPRSRGRRCRADRSSRGSAIRILRTSPDGMRTCAYCAFLGHQLRRRRRRERTSLPPSPGRSSMLWMTVPSGIVESGKRVAGLDVGLLAGLDHVADFEAGGREDVALLAVAVVEQRDARGAVRIVLDRRDLRRDRRPCCRLKSMMRYCRRVPPPLWRTVMWPLLLRPECFFLTSISDFSALLLGRDPKKSMTVRKRTRRRGRTKSFLTAIAYCSK